MRRELGFRVGIGAFAVLLLVLVAAIGVELTRQSWLSIEKFGLGFWFINKIVNKKRIQRPC